MGVCVWGGGCVGGGGGGRGTLSTEGSDMPTARPKTGFPV